MNLAARSCRHALQTPGEPAPCLSNATRPKQLLRPAALCAILLRRRNSYMWNDMFVLAIPLLEKVLRPVVVYLALVVLLRIFGKRELAQLNPFDLVVLLSLSNTVQNAIIGNDNSITGGLIGAFTLLAVNYLVVRFLFRHRRLDQVVEGKPTTLIEGGKVIRRN